MQLFLSIVALTNKTANTARNHRQHDSEPATIGDFVLSPKKEQHRQVSFLPLQANAITPEAITMIQVRQDTNPSWLLQLYYLDFSEIEPEWQCSSCVSNQGSSSAAIFLLNICKLNKVSLLPCSYGFSR